MAFYQGFVFVYLWEDLLVLFLSLSSDILGFKLEKTSQIGSAGSTENHLFQKNNFKERS